MTLGTSFSRKRHHRSLKREELPKLEQATLPRLSKSITFFALHCISSFSLKTFSFRVLREASEGIHCRKAKPDVGWEKATRHPPVRNGFADAWWPWSRSRTGPIWSQRLGLSPDLQLWVQGGRESEQRVERSRGLEAEKDKISSKELLNLKCNEV